jgi:aspartate racemase
MNPPLLGVLGGMGPLAAVDFARKLLDVYPVESEQQHIPTLLWNVPQIPDRQLALSRGGPSPLPAMLQGIAVLNAAGATRIAIPCNTAHRWFDELAAASTAPLFHIVDATLTQLDGKDDVIGLLATRGALRSRLYQDRLDALQLCHVANTDDELDELFMPGCYAVKHGKLEQGGRLLETAAQRLLDRGATRLILACTEVATGLESIRSALLAHAVDTNRALAQTCVDYWRNQQAFTNLNIV